MNNMDWSYHTDGAICRKHCSGLKILAIDSERSKFASHLSSRCDFGTMNGRNYPNRLAHKFYRSNEIDEMIGVKQPSMLIDSALSRSTDMA